jgi:hypothetical protein
MKQRIISGMLVVVSASSWSSWQPVAVEGPFIPVQVVLGQR